MKLENTKLLGISFLSFQSSIQSVMIPQLHFHNVYPQLWIQIREKYLKRYGFIHIYTSISISIDIIYNTYLHNNINIYIYILHVYIIYICIYIVCICIYNQLIHAN